MFSLCLPDPGDKLTLIAGLASEAGVALAFIGSHTFPMLTARLTQSYSGGEEKDQCSALEDYLYKISVTKHLIPPLLDLAVNYLFTPHYSKKTA